MSVLKLNFGAAQVSKLAVDPVSNCDPVAPMPSYVAAVAYGKAHIEATFGPMIGKFIRSGAARWDDIYVDAVDGTYGDAVLVSLFVADFRISTTIAIDRATD